MNHPAGFFSIALGTLVSEDLTCIAAGIAAGAGQITLLLAVLACLVGIFAGDLMLFALGRTGAGLLRSGPVSFFIKEDAVRRAQAWFLRNGAMTIVSSRFVPGLRLPTYVAAGVLKMPFLQFLPWFALGAILWTPLIVVGAFFAGQNMTAAAPWQIGLTAVSLLAILRLLMSLVTFRGRRLLYGKLLRFRWEYWPSFAVYPPVAAYCLWLAIRYRGLLLFTACNPAIPGSGIKGESKSAILEGLGTPLTARFKLLANASAVDQRLHEALQCSREWGWPVVIKPDRGERGKNVHIAKNEEGLRTILTANSFDGGVIVQEYAAGLEFGILYARMPSHEKGRIVSITRKIMPAVHGNGRNTLEELILMDARAPAMARHYFEACSDDLDFVLPEGTSRTLVQLGTHSRGCLFLNGIDLRSEALEERIDNVSKGYAGFFLGRYDVRCPSEEALQAGRDIRILELNGVTSEPTHIYDPSVSLVAAYRALFEHWRLAFAIGSENRARGCRVLTVRELIRLLRGGPALL